MKIRSGCPEKLLYVDDLTLVSESLESLKGKQEDWKGAIESKGLTVNAKKTKVMISRENTGKATVEGKFLCAICREDKKSDSSASFADIGCMREKVVLKVN